MDRRNRTPAYWPTRIMLAAGAVGVAVAILGFGAMVRLSVDCFSCDYPNVFGLPSSVVGAAAGVGVAVFGLVWMIRIFRGPHDGPPPWRYRDR